MIGALSNEVTRHVKLTRELRERVDYLTVAVMRGDPRYAKQEYVDASFNCKAFDEDWAGRGKRVPSLSEVFG